MKDESLKLVLTKIIQLLDKMDIPREDKIELMFNFMEFLNTRRYEDNVRRMYKK